MNHVEATEEFFRLRGWEDQVTHWSKPDGEDHVVLVCDDKGFGSSGHYYKKPLPLPNICESMTDWIKYVAEFMEGEGFSLDTNKFYAMWYGSGKRQQIHNHQILLASVLAANEYLKVRQHDIGGNEK